MHCNLIPKVDKELTHLNNWSPLSLLSVYYKIAIEISGNIIKQVLFKSSNGQNGTFVTNYQIYFESRFDNGDISHSMRS